MLDAEDQVEFGAGSDSSSTACYRHFDEKSNRKSCTLGAAKVGDKYKAGIMFELEESWYPWEDGTGDYKYLYKLSIDVAPGEFDKVLKTKAAHSTPRIRSSICSGMIIQGGLRALITGCLR